MIWSIFMHAIMGYFGTTIFTWTTKGILFAVIVAICTQGVNLFQLKRDLLRKAEEEANASHKRAVLAWKENKAKNTQKPEMVKATVENMKDILLRAFVKNTAICSAVTLLVSEFARSKHIGL